MQMLETLVGGDPFVMKNALCLKRMAAACAMIALIYAVKCFIMFSFATVAVVMVFAVGGLFCVTLKNVFEQATEYKNENDLTI
jgi:fatty acid desaturase